MHPANVEVHPQAEPDSQLTQDILRKKWKHTLLSCLTYIHDSNPDDHSCYISSTM